jgi:hypothetical protein
LYSTRKLSSRLPAAWSSHILKPLEEEALLNSSLISKAKGSVIHQNLRLGKGNAGYGLYACSHAANAYEQTASSLIAIERGEELLHIPKSAWSRYSYNNPLNTYTYIGIYLGGGLHSQPHQYWSCKAIIRVAAISLPSKCEDGSN